MSLSDISAKNLGVILKCMRTDPRHIDSLRKTCKSFNQQAVEMGLDQANDVYLSLSIERIKKPNGANAGRRQFERDVMEIRAVIKKKRSDMDPDCTICFKSSDTCNSLSYGWSDSEPLDGSIHDATFTHASDSENNTQKEDYPVGSGRKRKVLRRRRRAEPVQDPNESDGSDYIETGYSRPNCSCKNWFSVAEHSWTVRRVSEQNRFVETFLKAIKRVKSVRKLKIKCWRLDDAAMTFLTQQQQLRSLECTAREGYESCLTFQNHLYKLVLLHCSLNVQENSFHRFIRSFPVKIAQINCKFRNYQLDNKALHKIKKITVTNVCGKSQFVYLSLTDDLLKYWEKRPPIEVFFDGFETRFTISGILQLAEACVARKSTAKYYLGEIRITVDEFRTLLYFMQRKRHLLFKCTNDVSPYRQRAICIAYRKTHFFYIMFQYKLISE